VKPAAKVNVDAVPMSVVVSRLSFNCCSSSSSRRNSRRSLRSTTVSVYASEIEDEELASGGIEEPSGEGSDEELVSPVTTDADDPLNLNAIASPEVSEGSKLYVGNLPWTCDSQQLAEVFQDCGSVELVEVLFRNLVLFSLAVQSRHLYVCAHLELSTHSMQPGHPMVELLILTMDQSFQTRCVLHKYRCMFPSTCMVIDRPAFCKFLGDLTNLQLKNVFFLFFIVEGFTVPSTETTVVL
jgi:RNA recognition motif-containing protein